MNALWNLIKGICTVTGFWIWGSAITSAVKKKCDTGLDDKSDVQ